MNNMRYVFLLFHCFFLIVEPFHPPRVDVGNRPESLSSQRRFAPSLPSSARLLPTKHCFLNHAPRRTNSLGSTASLVDVAIDIPLPIYPSGATKSLVAPFRRLLLFTIAAALMFMFRATVVSKLAQWIRNIKSFSSTLVRSPVTVEQSGAVQALDREMIRDQQPSIVTPIDEDTELIDMEDNSEYDFALLEEDSFDITEASDEQIRFEADDEPIENATPMLFEDEGWGQARFVSYEKAPESTLVKLSFELPRPTDYIPLAMGDNIRICCIGKDDTPLEAEFYPYGTVSSGSFAILAEDPSVTDDETKAELLKIIMEEAENDVAIQPATEERDAVMERITPWELAYNNIHTLVYWANGSGIASAKDHLESILESEEAAGVQNVNLLWVNSALGDFQYAEADLEEQYERNSDRLAIACVSEDAPTASDEVESALVEYEPGMMAVLSGPVTYTTEAAQFLMEHKGYPEEAICIF